ncbi:ester cyclase [Arenibacter sp. F26102]|uniref:ester cyclase n=1 Tax=Arenibacter sp. F26102 TaxID=2926416 RepID=UPI001FF1F574|nr:ester cyclase [Arenibacter sp. F26102]MCK0146962.1 ester cyclase [Arenibacter sp. F26102]
MKSPVILFMFMVMGCISCKNDSKTVGNEIITENNDSQEITEKNKLQSSIDAYLNIKDEEEINGMVTDNYIRNMNGIPVVTNKSELKARINLYTTGFPDHNISLSNSNVCENEGYVNWVFYGTHTGQFADVTATGKKVKINGFSHLYFNEEGQIYQEDIFYNELEFLQQLGYSLVAPILE